MLMLSHSLNCVFVFYSIWTFTSWTDWFCHSQLCDTWTDLMWLLPLSSLSGKRPPGFLQRCRSSVSKEDHDGRNGVDRVWADDGPHWTQVLKASLMSGTWEKEEIKSSHWVEDVRRWMNGFSVEVFLKVFRVINDVLMTCQWLFHCNETLSREQQERKWLTHMTQEIWRACSVKCFTGFWLKFRNPAFSVCAVYFWRQYLRTVLQCCDVLFCTTSFVWP